MEKCNKSVAAIVGASFVDGQERGDVPANYIQSLTVLNALLDIPTNCFFAALALQAPRLTHGIPNMDPIPPQRHPYDAPHYRLRGAH